MRKFTFFGIFLSVLWGGYWYGGSSFLQKGATDFLASDFGANDAVEIRHSGLTVQGFPHRFDAQLTDVILIDKKNQIRWNGVLVRVYAPSYKPYQITLALPQSQGLQMGGQDLEIVSSEMMARVGLAPLDFFNGSVIIDNIDLQTEKLAIKSNAGWQASTGEASLVSQRNSADPKRYDLGILANAITLPEHLRLLIDPAGQQPQTFDSLTLKAGLEFSNPWDLTASPRDQPQLTEIRVDSLDFIWGALRFSTQGSLKIDADGYPTGTLNLTADGWEKMFQLANEAKLVDPDFAQTIQNGLKTMAKMSDGEDIIKAPLNFADGQMSLGVFPIGPAPRFK